MTTVKMYTNYVAEGGTPITPQLAMELRQLVFGTAAIPMRAEWTQTPLLFGPPKEELAYGLRSPRNATRGLLSVVQGFVLKHLLFGRRQMRGRPSQDALLPSADVQKEALVTALVEILRIAADKGIVTVVLPSGEEEAFVPHSVDYFHDSVTEKLYVFTFKTTEELGFFIKRHYKNFTAEDEPGTLLLLYSAVLTRSMAKLRTDLDSQRSAPLTMTNNEEGSLMIVTLLLTGRATPYIHNGVINVGDENSYAVPQYGILNRCTIGLLLWDNDVTQSSAAAARQPGSRLKTPNFPIWITSCGGHFGVLFNRNPELLRNYHAEARFDLTYYSCSGHQIAMSIDNRTNNDTSFGLLERQASSVVPIGEPINPLAVTGSAAILAPAPVSAEAAAAKEEPMLNTPLQRLIHTKWAEAQIRYNAQPSMLSYLFSTNMQ